MARSSRYHPSAAWRRSVHREDLRCLLLGLWLSARRRWRGGGRHHEPGGRSNRSGCRVALEALKFSVRMKRDVSVGVGVQKGKAGEEAVAKRVEAQTII